MSKVSKTARASMARVKNQYVKPCPNDSEGMIATRCLRSPDRPGGMFWICPKCDHRERV